MPHSLKPLDLAEVNVYEGGLKCCSPAEVRSGEVRPNKVCPAEARPAEVRPAEVRFAEVRPEEVCPAEVRHFIRIIFTPPIPSRDPRIQYPQMFFRERANISAMPCHNA